MPPQFVKPCIRAGRTTRPTRGDLRGGAAADDALRAGEERGRAGRAAVSSEPRPSHPATKRPDPRHPCAPLPSLASSPPVGCAAYPDTGYLRRLLIHGARTVVGWHKRRPLAQNRWLDGLLARRPVNIATVALTNKSTRMAWIFNEKEDKPRSGACERNLATRRHLHDELRKGPVSKVVEIRWRRDLRVTLQPPRRRRQPPGRSRHGREYRQLDRFATARRGGI